ncbi:MAG: HNH endonuclease [Oscillospiraceae bacterium]|jgi:5-methylcytosine-specific restriction endonuclease McrA|nr:HNH endonuclease [Oscillospiraceae bacterium]
MLDDDVTNKKGIYSYVLTHREKYLHIRKFTDSQKRKAFENQKGICKKCAQQFELSEMEADHITPWSKGGKTSNENCQMLCKYCNRLKSNL